MLCGWTPGTRGGVSSSWKFIGVFLKCYRESSFSDLQHEFPVEPTLTSANMGENIILGCSPPDGQPRPIVRWAEHDNGDDCLFTLLPASDGSGMENSWTCHLTKDTRLLVSLLRDNFLIFTKVYYLLLILDVNELMLSEIWMKLYLAKIIRDLVDEN